MKGKSCGPGEEIILLAVMNSPEVRFEFFFRLRQLCDVCQSLRMPSMQIGQAGASDAIQGDAVAAAKTGKLIILN
jgi:hypothetical protein